ncbi:tRNA glutamyl-Q(34) synthetase GluQRS [Paucibacter sp. Y2R2-4]|uniref:tRNA glutamyl-Q(34) synthetase GluQRS n=1 Tax=Paucibacter sp. Y2R2-4 TaxID=2893553 RepID=UPI0021E4066B|nr:tRNA glutamyl-Q(34) synthetase GluQRS [Paucibacter sp. Y2R2-4]MCV2348795.1 tRNA glutamyl-Q(34) synthetase GluQRS [Paucibacter sp. Y2R2-4]
MKSRRPYIGRFAPSPTGPLHAGSLVAALASWLDARAHGGRWLIRIEDIDGPRCPPGTDRLILDQLSRCGLFPDEPPLWQSTREARYAQALQHLQDTGWVYGCACSRKQISEALAARGRLSERHGELVYPGTCRTGLPEGQAARAWRLRSTADQAQTQDLTLRWQDRRLGAQEQNLSQEVGDFVLKRADGLWAYQLAVVVDDAEQGISDIVRGEDLADNTPRQIRLQQLLGLPLPRYLHTPLVLGQDGQKLSKQNGAAALDLGQPEQALGQAAAMLGLRIEGHSVAEQLAQAVTAWRERMLA